MLSIRSNTSGNQQRYVHMSKSHKDVSRYFQAKSTPSQARGSCYFPSEGIQLRQRISKSSTRQPEQPATPPREGGPAPATRIVDYSALLDHLDAGQPRTDEVVSTKNCSRMSNLDKRLDLLPAPLDRLLPCQLAGKPRRFVQALGFGLCLHVGDVSGVSGLSTRRENHLCQRGVV